MTDDLRIEAFHEAGHAVSAFLLGLGVERLLLTAGRRGTTLRRRYPPGYRLEGGAYQHEVWPRAVARLAGPRAELIAAGDGECALDALELAMPGTDSNIVLEMLELINEEKCFEQLERADEEAQKLLESNWLAVECLATSLVEEEELPGERVAALLLGFGIRQGRIPVRLELPVGETSSAEELRSALEELEAFRGGIDHPQDQRWVDYHIELVRSWLARRAAEPADPQQPRHGNGRRS